MSVTRATAELRRVAARASVATAGAVLLVLASATVPSTPLAAQEAGCYIHRGTRAEAADRRSPLDSASVEVGGGMAKICYGSVRARDRIIMGELVPFGALWRTGADEPTTLHLGFPADVAGIVLEPGSYSLYTLPGREEWRLFLSGDYQRWGIPISQAVRAAEVGETVLRPESTEGHVENMRFRFEPTGDASADLVFEWERTRLTIPVRRAGG